MPGRILIVDDVATNRILMRVKLSEGCYDTLQADCGTAALQIARDEQPDLILLDLFLPDMDGAEVCTALKADPRTADIPVVIVTAAQGGTDKMRALQAGAEEVLRKPLDDVILLARVRSLLRARETEQELALRESTRRALGFAETPQGFAPRGRVALVARTPEQSQNWCAALQVHGAADFQPLDRAQALALKPDAPVPDVFVVAADLDRQGAGLRLLSDLRARPATRHAAIVISVPSGARDVAAMALDLGASDLLSGPFDPDEAAIRIETQLTRKQQADRLRASVKDGLRLAVTDPLTGLYNRRYAMPHLAQIAERTAETQKTFAVMILDLDRFKQVNDTHGHAAGDAVLVQVAALLGAQLRPSDLLARIGGEEFMVVLPECDLGRARKTAERLRREICQAPITLPEGAPISVSVSIGIATSDGIRNAPEDVFDMADKALFDAKAQGRNTVTVCRPAA
ncbi:diguanylate cyclase [Actibacterium ureilyticum]|uniref:diguanylate cyclase n=1 Tax=Actibacterium ureilyticum TaxID=1590614 RepID=UPI000BAAA8EF|nr:diguanylate cyclase [Actibacterium ureilyticum]